MRRGALLALVCACVVAIPAAVASTQAETVTLTVGETVPLKTVFDKKKKYKVVMSGLVKLVLDNGVTATYDPFYGSSAAECRPDTGTNLHIEDASGNFPDWYDAGRPPCRKDHRYEFVINDHYPVHWELHGKATAYIALRPDSTTTASGSFTLSVEELADPVVAVVYFGANANDKGALASTLLNGRGVMESTDSKGGGLANPARLYPVQTYTGVTPEFVYTDELRNRSLTVAVTSGRLWMVGAPGSREERLSLDLVVEVVRSNKPSCPARSNTRRGARGKLVLVDYPRGDPPNKSFGNAFLDLPCGVDHDWGNEDSDVTIRVTKVKKK